MRAPTAAGVKTTFAVQLAPMARVAPQLFVCAKSPVAVMLVMEMTVSPVLVKVKTCPVEATPMMTLPKLPVTGVRVAVTAGAGIVK